MATKTRKKMGRPSIPAKQRLSKVYAVRFRPEEERAIVRAIERSGKPQTAWLRDTLLGAARRTRNQHVFCSPTHPPRDQASDPYGSHPDKSQQNFENRYGRNATAR